jgi:REP element-mobilizing transposase RayT
MVYASHVIFCAYGFWLPNDPRGSWSNFVGSWELLRFGRATKTDSRRSSAWEAHDREARLAAKEALKYPAVRFSGVQARAVGRAFAVMQTKSKLAIWACSIMPEHVHMVIARHDYHVEQIVNLLKGESTRQLLGEGIHPFTAHRDVAGKVPKAWGLGLWKVFLDSTQGITKAIQYVRDNPAKEGLPSQTWSFVTEYDPYA